MFQVLVVCVVHFVAVIVRRVAIIGPGIAVCIARYQPVLAVCIARYQNSLLTRVRTYWLAVWIRADTFVSQMSVSQLGVCPAQLWLLFPAARMAVLGALQRDGAKMVSVQRMRHMCTPPYASFFPVVLVDAGLSMLVLDFHLLSSVAASKGTTTWHQACSMPGFPWWVWLRLGSRSQTCCK